LNNTLTQPIEYGIERKLDGKSISSDYPLSLDSAAWSAIDEISYILGKSDFFNTVAVYNQSLRKDNEWLSILQLSTEQKNELFDIGNYNALLVVERLLFNLKEDVKPIRSGVPSYEPTVFADMRIVGIITCSMYAYGKENPVTTFNVQDSLFFKSMVFSDSLFLFKEIPEMYLEKLSNNLGAKAAKCFIPEWKQVDRFLFVSQNSRMREAVGYAANHRWANAESIWMTQLDNDNKPAKNVKIAYNLAMANEMQDKFESALEWVIKAKEFLKNVNTVKYSREIEIINKYTTELSLRIQSNRLLDLQWGKE
jgi:tetratricopeptide (TPR) repeat protein